MLGTANGILSSIFNLSKFQFKKIFNNGNIKLAMTVFHLFVGGILKHTKNKYGYDYEMAFLLFCSCLLFFLVILLNKYDI